MLTGPQRKALETRARAHARKLEMKIRHGVEAAQEPPEVVKARQVVKKWEARQDKSIDSYLHGLGKDLQQLIDNLLFDPVDSCLQQIAEFEERTN